MYGEINILRVTWPSSTVFECKHMDLGAIPTSPHRQNILCCETLNALCLKNWWKSRELNVWTLQSLCLPCYLSNCKAIKKKTFML